MLVQVTKFLIQFQESNVTQILFKVRGSIAIVDLPSGGFTFKQ